MFYINPDASDYYKREKEALYIKLIYVIKLTVIFKICMLKETLLLINLCWWEQRRRNDFGKLILGNISVLFF